MICSHAAWLKRLYQLAWIAKFFMVFNLLFHEVITKDFYIIFAWILLLSDFVVFTIVFVAHYVYRCDRLVAKRRFVYGCLIISVGLSIAELVVIALRIASDDVKCSGVLKSVLSCVLFSAIAVGVIILMTFMAPKHMSEQCNTPHESHREHHHSKKAHNRSHQRSRQSLRVSHVPRSPSMRSSLSKSERRHNSEP